MSTNKKQGESPTSVSLKDVLDASPAEDKAETRVMRSIEQDEELGGSLRSAGILKGVSEQGSNNVFAKDSSSSKKPSSVEEELYGLTNQMKDQAQDDTKKSSPSDAARPHNGHSFVHNAGRLINLQRAEKVVEGRATESYENFKSFLGFRKDSFWLFTRSVLAYLIIPGLGITCLLFYALGNPGAAVSEWDTGASSSWWVNFVMVRAVLTLCLAKGTEAVLVDFFCLNSRIGKRLFGTLFTLMLVQSKGWPFQLLTWGVFNFAMLYGNRKFAKHWLFYQKAFDVFNANNPAGTVLEAESWKNLLISAVVVGGVVALKRFIAGLWFGQSVYRRYGKDLSNVMKKAVLIAKVANLSKDDDAMADAHTFDLDYEKFGISKKEDDENKDNYADVSSAKLLIDTRNQNLYAGGLAESQKAKIDDLLGEWEEPTTDERKVERVPLSAMVQFQAASTCIDNDYPFSPAFGLADTREACIESSQKLFLNLAKDQSDSNLLKFDTIAMVAIGNDGHLNETQVKGLIDLFRPTREGDLTMLDFVKSIDTVYKDLRIIRASIANADKMNAASQSLFDMIFYFILACIVLAILGVDPFALFGALTAFIVGFAFMIGGASSKYFEGLLLVLVRKPFDIGDRIAVSGVENDVSGNGSSGWIVKDLNLFCTTVIFGTTGEEATYSNGSLANSRIINHNRSPKASLNFLMRFGIDTSKEKIAEFSKDVEQFVKNRPRQWLAFSACRLTNVVPDQGYIEYKVIMQHRESWQQIGALLTSKADVQLFAYELSKELGMGYENPALPVILSTKSDNEQDIPDIAAIHRAMSHSHSEGS